MKGYLCLKNWIRTIYSFQDLWKMLKSDNFIQLIPRYINQDPLENCFGCIRATGYRNINPTCTGFRGAYKVLLLNNLCSRKNVGQNCENINNGELLFTLQQFISEAKRESISIVNTEEECIIPNTSSNTKMKAEISTFPHEKTFNNITAIKKKILKASFKQCDLCQETLSKNSEFENEIYFKMQKVINENMNNVYYRHKIVTF